MTECTSLFMQALHNQLLFLVDLGRYSLAKKALFKNRRSLIYNDRISALRLRGIEGRIFYGLGELVSAELAFQEEKEGMAAAGMNFHAAIVSLEFAMVLLRQNRFEEAEDEVWAAREIFASVEIYREYLGAVTFLEECLRHRVATAELIEVTVKYLWREELHGPARRRQ